MGDGSYAVLAFSREFAGRRNYTVGTSIGYNDHQWTTGTGWSDWNLSVSTPLGKRQSLTVGYTRELLDTINSDDDEVWLGLTLNF